MASSTPNRVEQSPLPVNPIYQEYIGKQTFKAGEMGNVVSDGELDYPAASTVVSRTFVVENVADARGIDDPYIVGELVRTRTLEVGQRIYAWLANGNSVNPSSRLVADGAGGLKLVTAETGKDVIARPVETLNNTSGVPARLLVEVI